MLDKTISDTFALTKAMMEGSEIQVKNLRESLSPEDFERLGDQLAVPSILMSVYDKTYEAWMYRIGLWGKVTIKHNDPEFRIKGEVLTQASFIDKVANQDMVKLWGLWDCEELSLDTIRMWREYKGLGGKKWTEEFFIHVDIKPELRRRAG